MREWFDDLTARFRAALKASAVFLAFAVPAAIVASLFLLRADNGFATMCVLTLWYLVMDMGRRLASRTYDYELNGEGE